MTYEPTPGPWVEGWLSTPRFSTYLTAAAGDRGVALALYEWNTAMSAAILHDLAHLEVAIRNVYDAALVARQPGSLHWTEEPLRYFPVALGRAKNGARLDRNELPRKQIRRAVDDAGGAGAPRGKVVAELMFGFWRYMTTKAHEIDLWRPYLHHGFVVGTNRQKDVDNSMGALHRLRNRVAHHEPLLTQNLSARREDLLGLVSLLSPELHLYVAEFSTWATVQSKRPPTA